MITRTIKLKLTKKQENELKRWFWHLTAIYNWAIRKIELNAKNKIYFSKFDFQNILAGTSKRINVPGRAIQSTLMRAYNSWRRCFKKISKKPKFKSNRNKLNSIEIYNNFSIIKHKNRIRLPLVGKIKYYKQKLPDSKIKCIMILKKSSGWYVNLVFDCDNKFEVKETNKIIGIDPGFSTLLTLSDGTKIENPRELRKNENRIAQAQRGRRKKLVVRLHEKQVSQRKDRNHKISRKLIEDYKTIYYSKDNLQSLSKNRFGKSVTEASLYNLIGMLNYKCRIGGREIIPINSKYTTMTCSNCWSKTGPTGFNKLAVRFWTCSVCGTHHDRDINSAMVVLKIGLGANLNENSNIFDKQKSQEISETHNAKFSLIDNYDNIVWTKEFKDIIETKIEQEK